MTEAIVLVAIVVVLVAAALISRTRGPQSENRTFVEDGIAQAEAGIREAQDKAAQRRRELLDAQAVHDAKSQQLCAALTSCLRPYAGRGLSVRLTEPRDWTEGVTLRDVVISLPERATDSGGKRRPAIRVWHKHRVSGLVAYLYADDSDHSKFESTEFSSVDELLREVGRAMAIQDYPAVRQ